MREINLSLGLSHFVINHMQAQSDAPAGDRWEIVAEVGRRPGWSPSACSSLRLRYHSSDVGGRELLIYHVTGWQQGANL